MAQRTPIKDWTGKIIGFVDYDPATGNKTLMDFGFIIKGKYNAKQDVTTDFYGKIVAKGDQLMLLLNS